MDEPDYWQRASVWIALSQAALTNLTSIFSVFDDSLGAPQFPPLLGTVAQAYRQAAQEFRITAPVAPVRLAEFHEALLAGISQTETLASQLDVAASLMQRGDYAAAGQPMGVVGQTLTDLGAFFESLARITDALGASAPAPPTTRIDEPTQ